MVRARRMTRMGYRVLLAATRGNGGPVPFGATAASMGGDARNTVRIVGDKAVFLSGLPEGPAAGELGKRLLPRQLPHGYQQKI